MNIDYVKKILKNNSKEENLELFSLTEIIINTINSNMKKSKLSKDGDEQILEYVILHGYEEIMLCVSITLKKYHNLKDEEIMSKLNGVIYNRKNQKKLLLKI
jgi:hypothetical protein